jgi:hypothetical protein
VQSLLTYKIDNIHWLTTDNLDPAIEAAWQQPLINQETLAFYNTHLVLLAHPKV